MFTQGKRSDTVACERFQVLFALGVGAASIQQVAIQTVMNRHNDTGAGTALRQFLDGNAHRKRVHAAAAPLGVGQQAHYTDFA